MTSPTGARLTRPARIRATGRSVPAGRLAALLLTLALLAGCGRVDDPTAQPATTVAATTTTTVPTFACPPVLVGCPRPDVTPGATIPSDQGACTTGYNPRRELTRAAKLRVLAAYGYPADANVAEWDHLIPRWAGGTSTPSNVWPQVNPAETRRKDRLEAKLYQAVCQQRTLTLAQARDRMRHYWAWW